MDFFTYKKPNSLLFFIESGTVDQEHWWGLEWWSCEEQGRKLEQRKKRRKNFSSDPHPQSPLFLPLIFIILLFARQTRLWDCSYSTYSRHFLLLILIIYITLLLISSFQMMMTFIEQ